MSIAKSTISEFTEISNFLNILGRIREVTGLKKDKDIALEIGITPTYLSNVKRSAQGKLTDGAQNIPFKQIMQWAIENNVNVLWLFTGMEPEESAEENTPTHDKMTKATPTDEKAERLIRILLKARELHYKESGKPADPLPAGGIEMDKIETLFLELLIINDEMDDNRRAWLLSELQTLIFKSQDKLAELKR